MMELNESEFDRAFREKVLEGEPVFDELAWQQLERKLNKRDRVLFFRKATVFTCVLALIAFVTFRITQSDRKQYISAHIHRPAVVKPGGSGSLPARVQPMVRSTPDSEMYKYTQPQFPQSSENTTGRTDIPEPVIAQTDTVRQPAHTVEPGQVNEPPVRDDLPVTIRRAKKPSLSLAVMIGPEFNSVSTLVGGKPGFTGGLLVSVGITHNLSLQTGVRYTKKEYNAGGYDYAFRNAGVKDIIAGIDASCAVLEIPMLTSYTVADNPDRSIDVNAGVTSYLMLTEDYLFKYSPQSGEADRSSRIRSENQHYFGVIDLSATYYIKMKKDRIRLGLEPFIKIPLTGVGQGKINLKSNGVSFKLRYDLYK